MNSNLLRACAVACALTAASALAAPLRVLVTGLGSGRVTSNVVGIDCTESGGAGCSADLSGTVVLTPVAPAGSVFAGWNEDLDPMAAAHPDCVIVGATCTTTMSAARSVKAKFNPFPAVTTLEGFAPTLVADAIDPGVLAAFLSGPGSGIRTPAQFLAALPVQYRRGWLMMTRSESLQTGTAELPRIMLASNSGKSVFTIGLDAHGSYPASSPVAIEYMQWDGVEKTFRFHEIRLADISVDRPRGVEQNDARCAACHSTRNQTNRGPTPGTDGIPSGTVKVKNKPNWDPYDSWGGLLAFNRDRIYRGSVEAAAFRKLLNPWTWASRPGMRAIIEQLQLQPVGVATQHQIRLLKGGLTDGTPTFSFDPATPGATEPQVRGSFNPVSYSFDRLFGGAGGPNVRLGDALDYVQLFTPGTGDGPSSLDEGRGVELFDRVSALNMVRTGDEVSKHTDGTGNVSVEPRPIALAIGLGCLTVNSTGTLSTRSGWSSMAVPTFDTAFFDARHGTSLMGLYRNTEDRMKTMPRRKADIQKENLDRRNDRYIARNLSDGLPVAAVDGLIQRYGVGTFPGASDLTVERLRQEIFQRPIDLPSADQSEVGGDAVDREEYGYNSPRMTLYRYFLEPLGVSVDKWSTGVRGRSRTYTFADVLDDNEPFFIEELQRSLDPAVPGSRPIPGLPSPASCNSALMAAVVNTVGLPSGVRVLPEAAQTPTFTDVQRIFNKSCIECHGGLNYPPYANRGTILNFSEDATPPAGDRVLTASHRIAESLARDEDGPIFDRINNRTSEDCYDGMMPCGGPKLSNADIETIRRWIRGGNLATEGDPHLKTIDGVEYDFQAAGEFVLFRAENLEVQVRHMPIQTEAPVGPNPHTGLTSCASLTSAVAMRVGPHRLTFQPGSAQKPAPVIRLDGKEIAPFGTELRLAGGGRLMALPTAGFQVETPGGTIVSVTTELWAYYGVYFMNVNVQRGRGTEGLIGSIAPGNWLPALPDNTQLGARPAALDARYDALYKVFGKKWRVDPATSLFDYEPGTTTASFTLASWPEKNATSCQVVGAPPQIPVKPALKSIPESVAKQYCAAVTSAGRRVNCERDVAATGDAAFAAGYLSIEINEKNRAPIRPKLDAPNDNATATSSVVFKWYSTSDPDGNAVKYRHCIWDVDDRFTLNTCDALSTATSKPLSLSKGKDFFWKVIAEDGRGGTVDSQTRRISVR